MVRTLPFHGNNTGSNPVRSKKMKIIKEIIEKSLYYTETIKKTFQ